MVLTLSHPLDYLSWLLGAPLAIWANLGHSGELDIDVEDQAEIGIEMGSGALASVHLDYLQRPASHWLEVVGTEGWLHWDAFTGLLRVFQANGSQREFPLPAGYDRNELFLEEMRHFLKVVAGEEDPLCSLQDGRRALEIALAAHISAERGQRIKLAS